MFRFTLLMVCLLTPRLAVAGESSPLTKTIDTRIATALKAQKLTAAPQAEQHELCRRIYLDILGRIPTPAETTAYLNDTDANKHHKLIDTLLTHPEMPVHWRTVFNNWLNGSLEEKRVGADEFLNYLEKRLAENAKWDAIAGELLDPSETDVTSAAAAYYLGSRLSSGDRMEQIDSMTVSVSSVFFGVQMQCAKCHDHPVVESWKQENYYGLAAFLGRTFSTKAKTGNGPAITERADGEIKFSGRKNGEQVAKLLFLDGKVVDAKTNRRKSLITVGVNGTNPYFKRAMANRMWKQLMGVGLVEPVDQIFQNEQASHPELLTEFAEEFANSGFDLRKLMSAILHSDAYLRTSKWNGTQPRPEDKHYAVAVLKPLSPPQFAISLAQATGYADVLFAKYEREKDKLKLPTITMGVVRKQFERDREYGVLLARFKQESDIFQANASHALYLSYNPLMKTMLAPSGFVGKLAKTKDNDEVIRMAYLSVLSRTPSATELKDATQYLATTNAPREELCRDVLWALLTSPEFRFNH